MNGSPKLTVLSVVWGNLSITIHSRVHFAFTWKLKLKVEQKSCPFNQSRKIVFLSVHDIERQYKILQVGNGWFFSSAPKTEHYGGLNVKLLELTIVMTSTHGNGFLGFLQQGFFDACERQRFNIMTTVKVWKPKQKLLFAKQPEITTPLCRIKFRLMELSPIPFDHLIFEKIWHENINYVCSMF